MFRRKLKWLWMQIKLTFFVLSIPLGIACILLGHQSIYMSAPWFIYYIAGNLFIINVMGVIFKKLRKKENV